MKIYNDPLINMNSINNKTVAVLGYGSQGRSQALNLSDSGVKVIVGLRAESSSIKQVIADGLNYQPIEQAVASSDIIAMLLPDEFHAQIYNDYIVKNIKPGSTLLFAHGFSIHFKLFTVSNNINIVMLAPKGIGNEVRNKYVEGKGVPGLVAVHQDVTGDAKQIALAYGRSIGCGRIAIFDATFEQEAITDLFGEQTVLCGGVPALIQMAFETLVDAGYDSKLAYFECLHELKYVVDLLFEQGMLGMQQKISNTAEFGALVSGNKIAPENAKEAMKTILANIENGNFTEEFVKEIKNGSTKLKMAKQRLKNHQIEIVGKQLRELMHSS